MKILYGCKLCIGRKLKEDDIVIGKYKKWFSDNKFPDSSIVIICEHKKICVIN